MKPSEIRGRAGLGLQEGLPKKRPRPQGEAGAKSAGRKGKLGDAVRPASEHQRAPVRLVPGRPPLIDVALLPQAATIPWELRLRLCATPPTQIARPCPYWGISSH